jgi:hypothetical protein
MCILCRAAPAVLAVLLSGCATVVEGSTQPIYVATTPQPDADCTVSNSRGIWYLTSPGTVVVAKSESVLKVLCKKSGWQDGTAYLTSRVPTSAMVGMGLPYVGIISAAVDGSTGASNLYPNTVSIAMKPAVPQTDAPAGSLSH